MQVKQIYQILNDVMGEVTGLPIKSTATPSVGTNELGVPVDADGNEIREYIVAEDLSNIVDIGTDIFDNNWKDNYVKALINRIGRSVFVDRTYTGYAPDILMDNWEYGSVMAKTRCKIFDAKANPSWSLQKGQTVNQFEFTPPDVTQKFYNDKVAWQIDCSFTDAQIRESMSSATELNRFYSMIENRINTSKTIYLDSLKMRTINNFIAEKIHSNNGVIDLLAGYNSAYGESLTAAAALTDKDFLRYAAAEIKNYIDFFRAPSAAFNIPADDDGNVTFTPREFAKLVLISRFANGMQVYLQSDTYHEELVKLETFETVPFWQSEGNGFDLPTTTRIDVKLASDSTVEVNRNYIIGVLFDRDALGVLNDNQRTTTAYNANGEYWTNFYKVDTHYFNDLAENGLVFVIGSGTVPSVTLSSNEESIAVAGTETLTATVVPAGATVTWTTSDSDVATVAAGVVTGVAAGEATITALITVDGTTYFDTCEVTVTANKSTAKKS